MHRFPGVLEWSWPWLGAAWTVHILSFLLVGYHCLSRRREAASALLWIFAAWAFPFLGPLFYLAFGVDRVPYKGFQKQVKDRQLLAERQAREDEALPLAYWRTVHRAAVDEPPAGIGRDLNRALNAILPEHPLLGGNAVTPLVNGDETYARLRQAIGEAVHSVHLQCFMIRDDEIGREFLALLLEKARQGVVVRLLYDRFGSTHAVLRGLFRRAPSVPSFRSAGWTQANPFKRQFQINLRNHRKIAVIDARRAFCGGINLHVENIERAGRPAIRDYHFELRGPIVQELQYTFMSDWYFMTGEEPRELLQKSYFPHIDPAGSCLVRLVNSGPASDHDVMAESFFQAITSAQREILAATPYFVPTPDLLHAVCAAARRGVHVKLIVPARNNHPYAGLAGQALYEDLLSAGVRVFERRPPFMHAKALIVDDRFSMVGTANLDVRSLRLNYETNLAVCDERFINRLKRIVLEDLALSDEIGLEAWRRRPVARRLKENFCHLLTPVL